MLKRILHSDKIRKITGTVVLCLLLIASVSFPSKVLAAGTDTNNVIAIVFDNSGSMYSNDMSNQPLQRWCQATYAMEVLASMMNTGDSLVIFPMNSITIGGSSYDYNNPYKMDSSSDPSVIRTIRSEWEDNPNNNNYPTGTPINSIDAASDYLKSQSEDSEKWLIVLTDGDNFHDYSKGGNVEDTKGELTKRAENSIEDMNVMYLKIGDGSNIPTDVSSKNGHQYLCGTASDSADVPDMLADMSNAIFGRDKIDTANGKEIAFDIPLKTMVVFAQGSDIENLQLTGGSGASPTMKHMYTPSYSTNSSYGEPDTSLSGVIVTYENLEAGTYSVSYDGSASSVAVYYEPDVDLVLEMYDSGSNITDGTGTLAEGTYKFAYRLVDKDGNDVTDSTLLGNPQFTLSYKLNGKEISTTPSSEKETEIELKQSDELTDVKVAADFLDKYHLEKTAAQSGIAETISIAGAVKMTMKAGQSYYQISQLDSSKPIEVTFSYNGSPLTSEMFDSLEFKVEEVDGLEFTIEKHTDQSAYYIVITGGQSGVYDVKASAVVPSISETEYTDKVSIELGVLPWWFRWLIILLAAALIVAIIVMIMNAKVLPRKARITNTVFRVGGTTVKGTASLKYLGGGKKTGSLTVDSPRCSTNVSAKCSMTLDLAAVDPRRTRSSARHAEVISQPSFSRSVNTGRLGTVTFSRNSEGKFVRQGAVNKNVYTPFNIGGSRTYVMTGQVNDYDGNSTSISLSVTIKFL